jgi:hypothetical protein
MKASEPRGYFFIARMGKVGTADGASSIMMGRLDSILLGAVTSVPLETTSIPLSNDMKGLKLSML